MTKKKTPEPPKSVSILGLGPSVEGYLDHVKRMGGRRALDCETWGINAIGDIINCDLIFHMDDMRVQEARAKASPGGNIAEMVRWLKTTKTPVLTSRAYPEYPSMVGFPLEEVINHLGRVYFNSTAAYAVAYAIYLGVKEINIWGFDFTMPNSHHGEKGRACVEFWLGVAAAEGIKIGVPENTSLLDTIEGFNGLLYGYDAVTVTLEKKGDKTAVSYTPRDIPTAEEIEARYDHSKPLVHPDLQGK